MRQFRRLFILLLLAVFLTAGVSLLPAKAEGTLDGVSFVRRSWNGSSVVSENDERDGVTPVPADGAMESGWYYLNSNVTVNGRINLTGDTWLILGDGYKLDVKGIFIPWGKTLTIYGQSGGTGKIYSHPTSGGAAIGGKSGENSGSVVIHGGVIEAYGDTNCAGIGTNDDKKGGKIVIYGGTVTAKGGENGAGIGGGNDGDGGTITIHGGTISTISRDGAGIGGGDDRSEEHNV